MIRIVCYTWKGLDSYVQTSITEDMEHFGDWMEIMLRDNPHINYFFITMTTDVFDVGISSNKGL